MEFFNLVVTILFLQPLTNLLVFFYQLLTMIGVPSALGFSVILLTVAIRVALLPFTAAQIRMSKKMQDIAPHISDLKVKHKDDKTKQQQEMMRLYKEHGVNPASGCLPLLLQIPIIYALYHVLTTIVNVNSAQELADVNKLLYFNGLKLENLWDPSFFGIPLGVSPATLMATMPLIILVPILTGVLQFFLSKMMMPAVAPKPKKGAAKKEDDFAVMFQKQSLFIFPIMIGYFAFSLPFGLSLYWNTFTVFGIIQQYFLVGLGGLTPWKDRLLKK